MIQILSIAAFVVLIIGGVLLALVMSWGKKLGILKGDSIYSDLKEKEGVNLFSKTLKLCGKPDRIRFDNNHYFPVEVKTTDLYSNKPFPNHVIQLMAYCLLVEEIYGSKPEVGFLKYNNKEFSIPYTDEARTKLELLINEILKHRQSKKELVCDNPRHNHPTVG